MIFTKGINHIGFHIENFDEIVEKCKTLKISMPYGVIEWESSRSVYIIDPNGYEVELSEVQGGGLKFKFADIYLALKESGKEAWLRNNLRPPGSLSRAVLEF